MATAIAGVSASDVSALGIPLSTKFKSFVQASPYSAVYLPSSKKYGLAQGSGQGRDRIGVLVGPEYQTQQAIAAGTDEKLSIAAEDAAQETNAENDVVETANRNGEDDLTRRLAAQENEVVAAAALEPHNNRVQHGVAEFEPQLQHVHQPYQHQYQSFAAVSPFRFSWHPEQVAEQQQAQQRYDPFAYYDQRSAYAVHPQQFYPFQQQNVLPINPYQFRGHYHQ